MSELTPEMSQRFLERLMRAQAVFAATANGSEIEEGLGRLNAYRRAWRGERSDEEKIIAATRALERMDDWIEGRP